ncbi:nuclear transport factor 2 family protein [Roseibium album]|uniref:nuclear transport factor 2 family protein n=1 Tax=Roseibium album TaxID=311410 RepID=UPI003BAF99C2
MPTRQTNISIIRAFVDAFNAADLPAMASYLAQDLVADVTQSDGSTKQSNGRETFMGLLEKLDIPTVRPRLTITQVADVNAEQVMMMVEVRAARKGRELHNFAAYLMTLRDQRIERIWMVEALPAESEEFWSR